MIYLLLFITATAVLVYVTSRWLRSELRELRAWLGEKWVVRRGGESQANLIDRARHQFEQQGLQLDFLIASRHVLPCYERLRRRHLERTPQDPLPAALVLALGADTGHRRLYLRTVVPRTSGPARDRDEFVDFDDVISVETVTPVIPKDLAPAAGRVLELRLGENRPAHHLHLEADWSISPDEIASRVRDLLAGRWRPDTPPAIVR